MAWWDEVASLLLDLVTGQFVLQLSDIVRVRKRLLAAIWIQVVIYGRRVDMGVKWALANTRSIGSTAAIVELEGSELYIRISDLTVAVAIGSIGA